VPFTLRQRNQLFDVLRVEDIDASDIELDGRRKSVRLRHKPTSSKFRVGRHNETARTFAQLLRFGRPAGPYHGYFTVTDGPSGAFNFTDWDGVQKRLASWADEIRYVVGTPDAWTDVQRMLPIAGDGEGSLGNMPFTADEQIAIAGRIEEIKQQARDNPELTPEHISGIEQKLDELVEASRRVGKKDWRVMLYGMAFGLIVNDAVPSHVVQGIITTVISGLGHIFGLGGPSPSIPA